MLADDRNEPYKLGEYDDPDGKGGIVVTEKARHYDLATQVNHSIWSYTNRDTGENWELPFSLRMFYPKEINALLRYTGFVLESKFGSYDESPFGNGSPRQLIVSR
jgi:hypothetical protein